MKWKLWINIATITALGLIIIFAWNDIAAAVASMRELNPWLLLLIIPGQLFVYFAQAHLFANFFRATSCRLPMRELFPAMLELNFVNHIFPSGGVSGFSYLTLRLKPHGISTAKSTLAQIARFAICFMGYIVLLIVALVALALQDHMSGLMLLVVSAITFTIIFFTSVIVFVIGSEQRVAIFTRGLARRMNRFIHVFRPRHPETIHLKLVEETFLELHEDYKIIRSDTGTMRRIFLWAMVVNLAEVALLYLVFLAHGAWVNPGAVIVAFVIASIAGFVAILPGGIGIYEPLMAGVLISAGVPAGLALSATLIFRVITLLLSLLTGYALYQRVVHKYGSARLSSQRTH